MWLNRIELPLRHLPAVSDDNVNIATRSTIRHKWTFEEKLTLSILVRCYGNNWYQKTCVFNAYFQGLGLPVFANHSFSENVLRAMWYDIDHKRHTNSTLQAIWLNAELSTSSSAWAVIRAALENHAAAIGLSLHKYTSQDDMNTTDLLVQEEASTLQHPPKRNRCARPLQRNFIENKDETEKALDDISLHQRRPYSAIQMPTKAGFKQNEAQLLTPPSSSKRVKLPNRPQIAKNLPRFGFRAFNIRSQGLNSSEGLRAGRFKGSTVIPPPPWTQTLAYSNDALRHINATPTDLTPFVSVTRNLIRAFHHGLKSASDSSIVVVDLHKVEKHDEQHHFGRVQSVKDLNLKSPDGYNGSGEYLVWGEVPGNAVISCQSITQILSNLPNCGDGAPFHVDTIRSAKYSTAARNRIKVARTPLTIHNGKAVGNLLRALKIPKKHLKDAVYSVIADWQFQASRSGMWQKNREFMLGIHEGFNNVSNHTTSLGSQQNVLLDESLKDEIFSDEPKYLCDDDLMLDEVNDVESNEELDQPIEFMRSKRKLWDTDFEDVRMKGEVSDTDASEDNTAINIPDDRKVGEMDLRDQMSEPTIDEEQWENSFIHDLEDVIGMKKPKIER